MNSAASSRIPHSGSGGLDRFYRGRSLFSLILLGFVVAIGAPILGLPRLRSRLQSRIQGLRTAWTGESNRIATMKVGQNSEPFPSEYQHPYVPPVRVKSETAAAIAPSPAYTFTASAASAANPRRKLNIALPAQEETTLDSKETTIGQRAEGDQGGAEDQPRYTKGDEEKAAYDLLIGSNSTVAGMVKGSNASLRFKSWDAARRGDAKFWVHLVFTRVADSGDEEYIWQIQLQPKEIIPLSYNARALPKS